MDTKLGGKFSHRGSRESRLGAPTVPAYDGQDGLDPLQGRPTKPTNQGAENRQQIDHYDLSH